MNASDISRFWSKIDWLTDELCWNWKGSNNGVGYGTFYHSRKTWRAHRISYEMAKRPLVGKEVIDHLCRNPACVNPAHLEAVSNRTNALRGVGPTAVNATLTHCSRGHELTPENTYPPEKRGGWRVCRKCQSIRNRGYYLKSLTDQKAGS